MNYKKLSIIIPVYNEKNTILKILNKLESINLPIDKEIVIVDDFSTDGTRDILKKLKNKYKIIYHEKNLGKGFALRTGFKNSTGDIMTIQDADLEYDPDDYNIMLPLILNNKFKVVYGSRFIGNSFFSKQKWFLPNHYIGNKLLSIVTSLLYFHWVTDMETCYKMFTIDVLQRLKLRSRRFDFEPEITAKILKKGYKIKEVPIHYYPRDFKKGKKITWRDGIKALWYLIKYRVVN
jgi:glycosyltransferase involved in cell wall biosynthesis